MRARSAWMKLHSAEYSAAQARAPTQLAGAWMALHGGTEARAAAAAVNLLDLEVNKIFIALSVVEIHRIYSISISINLSL